MKIINGYMNRPGVHCVSTSMRDIFEFNGYNLTEDFVFGLDSGLGFHISKNMTKEDSLFFLGGKRCAFDASICQALAITLIQNAPTNDNAAWEEVRKFVDNDIPVMLQADMYYLDYFEERPSCFGGHIIVLIGYDQEAGVAYVSERQDKRLSKREGDQFLPISFGSLRKARNSRKDFICQPERKWFVFKFDKPINFKDGIKKAIYKNADSFLHFKENGVSQLKSFPIFFRKCLVDCLDKDMPFEQKSRWFRKQLYFLGMCIEHIGTGGGAFRNMYSNYLNEVYLDYYSISLFQETALLFKQSASRWTALSEYFIKAVKTLKAAKKPADLFYYIEQVDDSVNECLQLEQKAFKILYQWAEH